MATDTRIGTAIKRARERRRWTQRQLADALGVNIKSVDNWENGRTSPRNSIGALEDVLGVTLDGGPGTAPDPLADLKPWREEWEGQVAGDPDLPLHIRRDLIERSREARDEYAARRAARRAGRERPA